MNKIDSVQKKINLGELSYDCALLVFPVLLGRIYDPLIRKSVSGIPLIWIFLLVSVYFIPLLIGRMYHNIFCNSAPFIKKTVIAILFTVTIFAYGNLLYVVISSGNGETTRGMFVTIAGLILIISGSLEGLAFQDDGNTDESRGDDKNTAMPVQIIMFLCTAGILWMFYMLMSLSGIFGDINSILLFLIALVFCVADIILVMVLITVFAGIRNLFIRAGVYNSVQAVQRFMIPFSVSFILVFFNIYADRLFIGDGVHGAGSIIKVAAFYIFTGILPLRIILMLEPPVKPVNIIMGIISSALMIYYVTVQ